MNSPRFHRNVFYYVFIIYGEQGTPQFVLGYLVGQM